MRIRLHALADIPHHAVSVQRVIDHTKRDERVLRHRRRAHKRPADERAQQHDPNR